MSAVATAAKPMSVKALILMRTVSGKLRNSRLVLAAFDLVTV